MSAVFDSARRVFASDGALFVDYSWDAWKSASHFMFTDEDFASIVDSLSDAAQDAVVLANVEWVCARHFREPQSAEVLKYIDAVWAASLTGASVSYEEFAEEEWPGPILGPLRLAQLIAAAQHFEADHDNASGARASWARNLVLHVINKDERPVFDRWTEASLETLKRYHPYETPRWNSIFDDEFSNVDKCPPDALSELDRYDPAKLDSYIAGHMARVTNSRFLGDSDES